jgi:glutamine---fructose-6-phosphate transaminase (isomerizing)
MCGIFGFFGAAGAVPDMKLLRKLAIITEQRGDHAYGLAWEAAGKIKVFKRPGPITDNLLDLEMVRKSSMMIGHCRWATHGSVEDNNNNHPHQAGRGWYAHNGVVRNYLSLTCRFGLKLRTECDSEVIGLLMAKSGGTLADRAELVKDLVEGPLAVIGLWARPNRMLLIRRGNPLHFCETKQGLYFASLPDGMPGKVWSLPDNYVRVLKNE